MILRGKIVKLSVSNILEKCQKSGECRLWKGALSLNGRPYIFDPEKYAKRLQAGGKGGGSRSGRVIVWRLKHGQAPEGRILMTCHNVLCLNPAHMTLTTEKDAHRLFADRGSYRSLKHRLARVSNSRSAAKLTPDSAALIRAELGHLKAREPGRRAAIEAMANRLGVCTTVVYTVLRGDSWLDQSAPNSSVWRMAA